MIPDPAMLEVAAKLAAVLESGARDLPADLFASRDVVIVENFAPYVFSGPDAVTRWLEAMRAHLDGAVGLRHTFEELHDVSRAGDDVYISLRTVWSGFVHGLPFRETGGWALVLTSENGAWRLKAYGWAVIETTAG